MKKIILLCLLSSLALAGKWEYLVYVTGLEFKDKKMTHFAVINENGKKVGIGYGDNSQAANAQMLREYFGKFTYDKAYEMDVLAMLGAQKWELVAVHGELNNSNQKYYFKKER